LFKVCVHYRGNTWHIRDEKQRATALCGSAVTMDIDVDLSSNLEGKCCPTCQRAFRDAIADASIRSTGRTDEPRAQKGTPENEPKTRRISHYGQKQKLKDRW